MMKTFTTSILCASVLLPVYAFPLPDESSSASAAPAVVSISTSDSDGISSAPLVSNSSAAPTFPAGTQKIAVNEGSGNLAAYGSVGLLGQVQASAAFGNNTVSVKGTRIGLGALVGSAAASTTTSTVNTCRPATSDEISKIPAYQKLLDGATSFASNQKPIRAYVNDPSYPDVIATICYSTDTVTLAPNGSPSCSSDMTNLNLNQTADGQTVTVSTGFKSEVSTTTTSSSEFSWSDTITAKASIPEVMEVSSEQTIGLQISNTQGTSTTTDIDSQTTDTVTFHSKQGVFCPVQGRMNHGRCYTNIVHQANVTKCTYEATGAIDVYLSGSIWFEYKDYFRDPVCSQSLIQPGAPCAGKGNSHPKNDLNHCYDNNDCRTHGHWSWDITRDLPNISDRSNPIHFKNGFESTNTGSYISDCDK